jgi:hypothetical protein
MFPGVMPPQRRYSHPSAWWVLGLAFLVVCLLALAPGAGAAVAARANTAHAQHGAAVSASAADTRAQRLAGLRASLRALHRAGDRSLAKPANPFLRLAFTMDVIAAKVEILLSGGHANDLAREARLAQRVLEGEIRRVDAAWRVADAPPQVAAMVRQLDGLTVDAAKASGARTSAELNAFKKAHLADIKYAGRRWLVERAVGRQGAVIISRGVRNPRLRNAIAELYRYGAKVGDGGTADMLLAEVRAGCRGGACEHWIKAVERRRNLLNIGKREPLSAAERTITNELVGALTKAIRAAGGT